MRLGVVAVLACFLFSCAPGVSGTPSPLPTPNPVAATVEALAPYFGSYRMPDGDVVVIARMGWFFDMRDSAYRTIYATSTPFRFTIGFRYLQPLPVFANLSFHSGSLTLADSGGTRTGSHIDYAQTDVTIQAAGAKLAGTITEPLGTGRHPGVVIVHGAERGMRYFYDVWVGIYASLGVAVLTYDKRGGGESTGTYPGEPATADSLAIYAGDANAALGMLARWPGIDPRRVGFHGGSQGGWTVPLAMLGHPQAAFAVLVSAPATTVGQADLWSSFSSGGETMPAESPDQMLAAVRADHSGYDPAPALRALTAPALWLLGSNDRTVPSAICLEILDAMNKSNFTVRLLPAGHGLLVNPTGLLADDARSNGLAPDLVPSISTWLHASGVLPQ